MLKSTLSIIKSCVLISLLLMSVPPRINSFLSSLQSKECPILNKQLPRSSEMMFSGLQSFLDRVKVEIFSCLCYFRPG